MPTDNRKEFILLCVPAKPSLDQATRLRIAAHLHVYMRRMRKTNPTFSQKDLATVLGVHPATASRLLKATSRSLGLDVVLAINRRLHIDAEALLNQLPGKD